MCKEMWGQILSKGQDVIKKKQPKKTKQMLNASKEEQRTDMGGEVVAFTQSSLTRTRG